MRSRRDPGVALALCPACRWGWLDGMGGWRSPRESARWEARGLPTVERVCPACNAGVDLRDLDARLEERSVESEWDDKG